MRGSHRIRRSLLALAIAALAPSLVAGCAKPKNIFMDTPALYSSASVDLDFVTIPERRDPVIEVLYATDRQPDFENEKRPYSAQRERFLRLGAARIRLGPEDATWDDIAESTTAMKRRGKLRMYLDGVDDFGALDDTIWSLDPEANDPDVGVPADRFASLIDQRLDESTVKEIWIYVAPFKVHFDVATFTAAEFFHYMGRNGVCIAYSWPTRTGTLDYLSATENAYLTVTHLRKFIEYLARETEAKQIHLMTYSAGARVLSGGLHELRIKYSHLDENEVQERFRIGRIVFTGPDIDKDAFGMHYMDGTTELARSTTIYTTKRDRALGMSKWLYGWSRLGSLDASDFTPQAIELLERDDSVAFVTVTNAERAKKDNAHGYFRHSPWVSSDILLVLALGASPSERGLIREPGDPVWRFPDDYRETVSQLVDRLAIPTARRTQ